MTAETIAALMGQKAIGWTVRLDDAESGPMRIIAVHPGTPEPLEVAAVCGDFTDSVKADDQLEILH